MNSSLLDSKLSNPTKSNHLLSISDLKYSICSMNDMLMYNEATTTNRYVTMVINDPVREKYRAHEYSPTAENTILD